jgi:hypothetical protein
MPALRLALPALFLLALMTFFPVWSEIGGAAHLELMPWRVKLVLGLAVALAFVNAVAAAVAGEKAWNGRTLRWSGIVIGLLVLCGLATYYYHLYYEEDEGEHEESMTEVRPVVLPRSPVRG